MSSFKRKYALFGGFIVLLVSCQGLQSEMGRINEVAIELAEGLDNESRSIILEAPEEFRFRLFDLNARIGIVNVYGLWGGAHSDKELLAECRAHFPNHPESELAAFCAHTILQEVIDLVLTEFDTDVLARVDAQTANLRKANLGQVRNRFRSDMHISEIVEILNGVLQGQSAQITIMVDESLLRRPSEWRGLSNWQPILKGGDSYLPGTVLDALHVVVLNLEPCFRQRPGIVWLGDNCTDFGSAREW